MKSPTLTRWIGLWRTVRGILPATFGGNLTIGAVYRGRIIGFFAPVAQLDRVPGYEPGGRGFKSCRARQTNERVAAMQPVFISDSAGAQVAATGSRARQT